MASINLNGRNTWKDFGLKMIERITDPPAPKRTLQEMPQIQGILDFSRGRDNEEFYEERVLHWTFGRVIPSQRERELLRYEIMQWAKVYTDGIITESLFPNLYYKEATNIACYFSPIKNTYFKVQLDFMAYPLRLSENFEGSDIFDTFNFDTDVWQKPKTKLPTMEEQLPYKQLNIGDSITLGGWSQFRVNQGAIRMYDTERMYTIKDIRDNGDEDHSRYIYSGIQYQLAEDNSWIRAQDIVQARNPTVIDVHNTGLSKVIPELITRNYVTTLAGITIEHEGNFYNFKEGDFNDKLALFRGKNKLNIYGQGVEVEFKFRKEVM